MLLLNSVIKRGFSAKDDDKSGGLLESIPKETIHELNTFAVECFSKAGLDELSKKLKTVSVK